MAFKGVKIKTNLCILTELHFFVVKKEKKSTSLQVKMYEDEKKRKAFKPTSGHGSY